MSTTYSNEMLSHMVDELRSSNLQLHDEIEALKDEAAIREKQRLSWGLGAVGTVAMVLGGILWGIVKGKVLP